MLTVTLLTENDNSFDLDISYSNKTKILTLAKVGGFSTTELVERWTRRLKSEHVRNRIFFDRYLNRLNSRHQKIISGEVEPLINN